jgi:hypothetical protein
MYEHWTDEQRARATGRWVSTEHEGAPPDTAEVLVHTGEFGDTNAGYATGYYNNILDKWFITGWAGVQIFDGYKGVAYWRLLPGRED